MTTTTVGAVDSIEDVIVMLKDLRFGFIADTAMGRRVFIGDDIVRARRAS